MAEAIANEGQRDLWQELKKIKGTVKLTPPEIDGKTNSKDICNILHDKYKILYNSVPADKNELDIIKEVLHLRISHESPTEFHFDSNCVSDGIKKLNCNKHDGHRGLWSNHLQLAPPALHDALSQMFHTMLIHGHTPPDLLLGTLVSLIKDNKGDNNFAVVTT
jgi:hypothetical protein